MQLWQLLMVIGALLVALVLFVVAILMHHKSNKLPAQLKDTPENLADEEIEHIFDKNFREELRNRGRLHFDKIIKDNAMFLQQDLRLTTSQINEFMQQEISKTLKEEFSRYEQSIDDAKQIAIDSIEKTKQAIEQQRETLGKEMQKQIEEEKARYIIRFEENMNEIVNHYILAAIGDQISLDDQLNYILGQLESNKKEIIDDIKNGA